MLLKTKHYIPDSVSSTRDFIYMKPDKTNGRSLEVKVFVVILHILDSVQIHRRNYSFRSYFYLTMQSESQKLTIDEESTTRRSEHLLPIHFPII